MTLRERAARDPDAAARPRVAVTALETLRLDLLRVAAGQPDAPGVFTMHDAQPGAVQRFRRLRHPMLRGRTVIGHGAPGV